MFRVLKTSTKIVIGVVLLLFLVFLALPSLEGLPFKRMSDFDMNIS
ncbi:hypothetical protein [Pedobacter hartonius]|uniref:Uncharacterized protein n=1 Tax=Pedobacter hartonius TaxID=425514 RepID=A0A1H3W7P6_9SPHI|nr:hypothetical protein [Pedobacter hartonius]SDZ82298.1 hypothetical protein SAMN05443550_101106 [Pedobacter hartonius]